ncbi:Hypothetical predicted protein [Olea europaea subsp. europaea]|uniref:Uncharacterized protein n=1 Tax=Olea europaea subsp. europaea TaxID=158383 RepID=A0A8S0TL30_OLEEU|nr:Hypothetical predicted protein [Olea europaea subsp. europaea]
MKSDKTQTHYPLPSKLEIRPACSTAVAQPAICSTSSIDRLAILHPCHRTKKCPNSNVAKIYSRPPSRD